MNNVKFFDVLKIIDQHETADIIQTLLMHDCLGTYFQDGIAKLYFNNGKKNKINDKLQKLNQNFSFHWEWEKQNKENWHLAWQKNFMPLIIDKKVTIIPSWHYHIPNGIVIKIKPGMAFGTGHHETTSLIISQMIKIINPGMSVLDLGTGSGILSIVAMQLGAIQIDAVENDPHCKSNFFENLTLNNIENYIYYHQHDILKWKNFGYDIILANINRDVIEKLIPELKFSKGKILLSGLLDTDYKAVVKLCHKYQLQVKEKIIKEEWLCLVIE